MKPTAILTADIHLRDDQPVCRLDNYWEAQARKIAWLLGLQQKHNCPILDAGDLFHKPKPSLFLLQWAIHNMPDMVTVEGNHDQSYHNPDLFEKTGLAVLEAAGVVELAPLFDPIMRKASAFSILGFPWSRSPTSTEKKSYRQVALMHIMTYTGRSPFPGCKDPGAATLLDKMAGFDLVVTGHNHTPFVVEREGRLLVNPGSLMRSTADQADHQPRVYLWYAEDNHVEPVFAPIELGVVSREHLTAPEEREERLSAFVSRLTNDIEVGLSFSQNMERWLSRNRVRARTKEIIEEAMQ